jgi:hypothetical protein
MSQPVTGPRTYRMRRTPPPDAGNSCTEKVKGSAEDSSECQGKFEPRAGAVSDVGEPLIRRVALVEMVLPVFRATGVLTGLAGVIASG